MALPKLVILTLLMERLSSTMSSESSTQGFGHQFSAPLTPWCSIMVSRIELIEVSVDMNQQQIDAELMIDAGYSVDDAKILAFSWAVQRATAELKGRLNDLRSQYALDEKRRD
jgi:hypothetical protein